MRTFILIAFLITLLSSCQTYQYLTLASDNVSRNEKNEFVAESDTLRVTYNFNGKNGPVNIHIYNKSPQALEIDWKRSSLIIGDRPVPFHISELQIDGSVVRSAVPRSSATINATVHGQEGIEFIPPHATIQRSGLYIKERLFDTKSVATTRETVKIDASKVKITRASFSKETSPMLFRCYLTFVIPGAPGIIFATEHSFYVSELLQTVTQPQYLIPEKNKAGDKFFVTGIPPQS